MSRALVIDTATGAVRLVLVGDPTMMAQQIVAGQSLWVMGDGDNGAKVNDRWVIVNGAGEFEILPGAPAGVSVPTGALEFVMSVT